MLEHYEVQIEAWLEPEPTLSAAVVLQRRMNVDQRPADGADGRESLASGVGPLRSSWRLDGDHAGSSTRQIVR
ncbi:MULTISPECIES: hypothetical protein [Rhizobium]|uniref:Uncharacterized protein n=1 Tax=Rhizobium favelukesii TaxID=348824 RepID=W6RHA5_9HYPH|nr:MULTISPECIES: hypothetical protein [Rhizobium]MCS0463647.1 hypothetical protein [Rhizobium favelukesii]UFS84957.1 hypothetical protein LPB79_31335 [Rhizobium sp. T136]CDM60189.1 hypothetical protein LPU83_pLPU83b_0194 [Rhizobium favelukesii]